MSRTAGLMSTASAAVLTSGGWGADVDGAEWKTRVVIAAAPMGTYSTAIQT